jgi:hypothetical protein
LATPAATQTQCGLSYEWLPFPQIVKHCFYELSVSRLLDDALNKHRVSIVEVLLAFGQLHTSAETLAQAICDKSRCVGKMMDGHGGLRQNPIESSFRSAAVLVRY